MLSIRKYILIGASLLCSLCMVGNKAIGNEGSENKKEIVSPSVYKRIVGPEQITLTFPLAPTVLGDKVVDSKAFDAATATDYSKDEKNPQRWGYAVYQNMEDPEITSILKSKAAQIEKNKGNHIEKSAVFEKNGYPAMEVIYSTQDSYFRVMIIKTPYNIYEIYSHGPKGAESDSFFNSVEVIQINQ